MVRSLFASAAALAMMTGVALAQTGSSAATTEIQSTTTIIAPAPGDVSSSTSRKTIDGNGAETDRSHTYTSGADGTKATATTTTMSPDGSETNTQQSAASWA